MATRAIRPKGIPVATQFEAVLTNDGYALFDSTVGRQITHLPLDYESATQKAQRLNEAAADGPRAIALALGAFDEDDDPEMAALAAIL